MIEVFTEKLNSLMFKGIGAYKIKIQWIYEYSPIGDNPLEVVKI